MPRVSLIVVILLITVTLNNCHPAQKVQFRQKNHGLNFPSSKILTLIRLIRIWRINIKKEFAQSNTSKIEEKLSKISLDIELFFFLFEGIIIALRSLWAHLWEITIFTVTISLFRRTFMVFKDGINVSATNIIQFDQTIIERQGFRIVLINFGKRTLLS